MFTAPVWSIPKLSHQLDDHFQAIIDNKTKPPGAVGKLETLTRQHLLWHKIRPILEVFDAPETR